MQQSLKLVSFFARFGLPDVIVSDNGPPFSSYNFVNFLERQGVRVMKSPPYNPSSNGQAERFVRTVKEVLKCFLLEPEVAELDLEDQMNLFLFNFRNTLTSDGFLPSEKIFRYSPKTILDLINPKKQYKQHKSISQPDEETNNDSPSGTIPRHSNDALEALMAGDEVWYKNHNPHLHARWLKATFIKRYSPNTFQIRIGSTNVMAHRAQIRISKDASSGRRPIVLLTRLDHDATDETSAVSGEQRENSEEIGEYRSQEPPRASRKRKYPSAEDDNAEPRRSKRKRKPNMCDDFYYN